MTTLLKSRENNTCDSLGLHEAAFKRRGVLLLVVLSMLTLFVLLGTTYIVFASRARTTSRAFLDLANEERLAHGSLRPMIREAAHQVIRGSLNNSSLAAHSLLADRYGGSIKRVISTAASRADNQFIEIQLATSVGHGVSGQVLTFLSGPNLPMEVEKTSVRIIDSTTTGGTLWIQTPQSLRGVASTLNASTIVVNNREFMNNGFSDTASNPDIFLPNWSLVIGGPSGHADESYDALDAQNMSLADANNTTASYHRRDILKYWIRKYGQEYEVANPSSPISSESDAESLYIEPLINNHLTDSRPPTTSFEEELLANLRRASIRPFCYDHGQSGFDFSGKPISINTLLGSTFDVDNDGDGNFDSVWTDFGASVFELPDRTLVKPLAAIRCVDLGGRIGLNTAGSIAHRSSSSGISDDMLALNRNIQGYEPDPTDLPLSRGLVNTRPSGIGFGAAGVRLDGILSPLQTEATIFGSTSLTESGSGIIRSLSSFVGRYGDGVGSLSSPAFPGQPNVADQRISGNRDLYPDADIPANWWASSTVSPFMGGPPDLWSRLFVGIDHRGHPSFLRRTVSGRTNEFTDYPYELDLTVSQDGNIYQQAGSRAFTDQPFTPVELEAVLRMYDADSAALLPQRMLATVLGSAPANRQLLTTQTWDTPGVIGSIPLSADVGIRNFDLLSGLRLNLNRPFGNGLDDDSDGIVDEPDETGDNITNDSDTDIDEADETADPYGVAINPSESDPSTMSGWNLTRGFTIADQPGPNMAGLRARQIMADNLFRLMDWIRGQFPTGLSGVSGDPGLWLFTLDDPTRLTSVAPLAHPAPLDSNLNSVSSQRSHARKTLAQWAVNIVDFLDADSIMTPYRFDTTGLPAENIVWGCEHPDLIVTETLAFHDRGIEDLDNDNGPDNHPVGPPSQRVIDGSDEDWDQVRLPQGSLFLELYAMRDPLAPHLPRELYDFNDRNRNGTKEVNEEWRLRLDRTPTGNPSDAPIWRLSTSRLRDPNDPTDDARDVFHRLTEHPDTEWLSPCDSADGSVVRLDSGGQIQLDRYVWFTNGNVPRNPLLPDAPNEYNTFRNVGSAGGSFSLEPGHYLVVGPRQQTTLGSTNAGLGSPSDQRIYLGSNMNLSSFGPRATSNAIVIDLSGSLAPTSPSIPSGQDPSAWDIVPPKVLNGSPLRPETQSCWVETSLPLDGSITGTPVWSRYTSHNVGLNISEKPSHDYYKEPPSGITSIASTPPIMGGTCPSLGYANDLAADPVEDNLQDLGSSLDINNLLGQGTHLSVAAVFIERLADPTRPHDPQAYQRPIPVTGTPNVNPNWNPYVIVDVMPIDLTVFNGETSSDAPSGFNLSPGALPPVPYAASPVYFHTRQRGFDDYFDYANFNLVAQQFGTQPYNWNATTRPITAEPVRAQDPWRPCSPYKKDRTLTGLARLEPPLQTPSPPVLATSAYFNYDLNTGVPGSNTPYQTLGWCNLSWGRRLSSYNTANVEPEVLSDFDGVPDKPLPWIVWNDRPFASEYELLNVPRTPASRLLTNYRSIDSSIPIADQYDADNGPPVSHHPFGAVMPGHHLLPLSPITDLPVGTDSVSGPRPRNCDILSRVFSYVRVPSRFAGTTIAIDSDASGTPPEFKKPFNKLPTYREPGRVNLNTIPAPVGGTSNDLWRALGGRTSTVNDDANSYPDWTSIFNLKETALSSGAVFKRPFLNPSASTVLTGHTSQALQENPEIPPPPPTTPPPTTPPPWYQSPGTTLSTADLAELTPRSTSLFAGDADPTSALFPSAAGPELAFDPKLSSWFRFEPLIRAASNATSRSEMYAIWVTVGLFEVQPVGNGVSFNVTSGNPTVQYPDGYKLLREYGSTSGDVTRHRGFYLFDRSIPVGFEPGVDLNIQDGILAERFIE